MNIKRINDRISVSEQIIPADVPAIVAAGFRTVINNRPDGEAVDQPSRAAVRTAVEAAGLNFIDIPFTSGRQTRADVDAFGAAVETSEGPILAYCRSGTRSASIWAMSRAAASEPVDEVLRDVAGAGYDLAALRPMLETLSK